MSRMKTVKVRSTVNTGGLRAGQEAEVEDSAHTRSLIEAGLWTLLVAKKAPKVQSAHADTGDDAPSLPFGDQPDLH